MIKKINLRNFKLHNETQIEISNLTILTGMNGMGKSSIIQSLLLLRQSFLVNNLETELDLKGDLCDLGASGELACQSSTSDTLELALEFDTHKELQYKFIYPGDPFATLLETDRDSSVFDKDEMLKYSLFNENFQYISAFRFGPQKTYNRDTSLVNTKRQISKSNGQCEYVVNFLDKYKSENIPIEKLALLDNITGLFPDCQLMNQIDLWLRRISPNVRIDIEPIGSDYKLNYKFYRDGNLMTNGIAAINTGFGITYILPILVAVLSAREGALIIIENPEAHIHPKGQAVLMELITLAAKNGVQIIIETHSDHIINGALVSIVNKSFSSDMLSIYYFERDEHKHTAIANQLEITEGGNIRRPPQGFFDQIDIDMKLLTGF